MKKLTAILLMNLLLAGCSKESSVGIIGGADGPTAVFVTSSGNGWLLAGLVLAVAAIVAAIILFLKDKRK